ncbi:response regulator [Streptosporangium sp. CA-135522]|uniref:response regulator n=1 Tax=Streptosporangium sp. CA-135522 TaxID=3240072 RepID=UPI003D8F06BC
MIRVLVAEDQRILREALVGLLDLQDDIEVVAASATGTAAEAAALEHRPDVAILDIEMPEMSGLEVADRLQASLPDCRILVLTGVGRPGHLRRAGAARVAGFMLKDTPLRQLIDAVRIVAAGGRVIDPQLAYAALDIPGSPLGEREAEVLRLIADGHEPRDVAEKLHLSYGTVRNYLASAITKLSARNRVDAIRLAREAGWI